LGDIVKLNTERVMSEKKTKSNLKPPPRPPLGNKYAVGNNGGRPIEYTRERRLEIAEEMIEWAKTHPDCLTVPHFTTSNGYSTHTLVEWASEDPVFSRKYKEAKEYIGVNRFNATRVSEEESLLTGKKALDKSIFLRHVGNFDSDKRTFDREEKAFESGLRQKEAETTAMSMQQLMNQKAETIEQK